MGKKVRLTLDDGTVVQSTSFDVSELTWTVKSDAFTTPSRAAAPSTILLPLTPAEYAEVRRWLGCPGHDGKRVLGEGMTGEGMIALRRKVEALAFDMEIPG